MTAAWVVEPCGPSDTSPADPPPAVERDMRGQVSGHEQAHAETVETGEYL